MTAKLLDLVDSNRDGVRRVPHQSCVHPDHKLRSGSL